MENKTSFIKYKYLIHDKNYKVWYIKWKKQKRLARIKIRMPSRKKRKQFYLTQQP